MTFNRSFGMAAVALFAIAASFPTPARELHNLVLLVPESLPAASVEEGSAPTLVRLKAEGVNFINSHSGFPGPVFDGETAAAADLRLEPLTAAAKANYSTLLMDDAHVELSSAGETRRRSRGAASLDAVLAEAPDDGTWQKLAERVQLEIELEGAVLECERGLANPAHRSP